MKFKHVKTLHLYKVFHYLDWRTMFNFNYLQNKNYLTYYKHLVGGNKAACQMTGIFVLEHIHDILCYHWYIWPLCCSLHKVYGLEDAGGVCWSGQYGKPNGKELAEARIPSYCYRCIPGVLQGSARAGRSGGSFKCTQAYLTFIQFSPVCSLLTLSFWVFQIVDNPAEVADKADRIITMLPSSPNVIEVYTGPNGILKYSLVSVSICTL